MSKEKKKGFWSEDSMKKAIEQVLTNKMGIRESSFHFSVPKSTLADKIKLLKDSGDVDLTPQMGRFKKTFSAELESRLIEHLLDLDKKMMPMNKKEFLRFVFEMAEHLKISHQFNKDKRMAGEKFYYEFLSRHSNLSLRKPQSTSIQRAVGFNKEQVDLFFNNYEAMLTKFNFAPSKIFNCDETGVSAVHENATMVLSQRGKKQVSKITSGERGKNVTVLLSINATGDAFLPPLFVFGRKKMAEELKKDAPEGSIFACEASGWITANSFLLWMKMFVARVNPTKESPALLILDGHSSHKELQVILYARDNNVHMISLPPHTTHKLQPLDRTIMRPFKAAYNEACAQWLKQYCPLKIAQRDIAGLVRTAFMAICRMDLARSGFSCTGLHPLKKDIFTELDYLAAAHFSENNEASTRPTVSSTKNPSSEEPVTVKDNSVPSKSSGCTMGAVGLPPATPSTSGSCGGFQNNLFEIVTNEISPVTDESRKKIIQRKRRSGKSEILTGSPYKNMLEKKFKGSQDKIEKKEVAGRKMQLAREKHIKQPVQIGRGLKKQEKSHLNRNLFNSEPTATVAQKKNSSIEVDEQETTECIICRETTNEDWVQCTSCKGWAHEACTDQESLTFYRCDNCPR